MQVEIVRNDAQVELEHRRHGLSTLRFRRQRYSPVQRHAGGKTL